jgi:hypothetical protein
VDNASVRDNRLLLSKCQNEQLSHENLDMCDQILDQLEHISGTFPNNESSCAKTNDNVANQVVHKTREKSPIYRNNSTSTPVRIVQTKNNNNSDRNKNTIHEASIVSFAQAIEIINSSTNRLCESDSLMNESCTTDTDKLIVNFDLKTSLSELFVDDDKEAPLDESKSCILLSSAKKSNDSNEYSNFSRTKNMSVECLGRFYPLN